MKIISRTIVILVYLLIGIPFIAPSAYAGLVNNSVYIEELTWQEIKDRIHSGATTAIVPTGGTEQNGPHMITGKHNIVIHYTSGEIAKKLGNALVAPVMAYVPEGRINPPEGHMMFAGTLSLTDQTFAAVLEETARSLKQHGFHYICFIGDHGGSQEIQKQVAAKLNEEWRGSGVRVIHVSDYYDKNGQDNWVGTLGVKVEEPGAHGGFEDTSELMALDPQGVRESLMGKRTEHDYKTTGAMGDSTKASATYGKKLLALKINAAVNQIIHVTTGR